MNDHEIEKRLISLGRTAPRLTPPHIDACIVGKTFHRIPDTYATLCVLALVNGHVIHGVNPGPVCAENFDPVIGEKLAYKAARDQIWPLEGYLLQQRLFEATGGKPVPAYGADGPGHADAAAQERIDALTAEVAELRTERDALIHKLRTIDGIADHGVDALPPTMLAQLGEPFAVGQILPPGTAVDDAGIVRRLHIDADAAAQAGPGGGEDDGNA